VVDGLPRRSNRFVTSLPEAGKRLRRAAWTGWAHMAGWTPNDAPVTWRTGLDTGQGRIWCPWARMAAVQHGSTATHLDAGGLVGTREDGDLQGWTRVDVLPPDGMQEVRSSNLLSSTWFSCARSTNK
jgi:hypothetical protein